MHNKRIKICGMAQPQNIEEVAALKPNFMGFIFYPLSKRYIYNTQDIDLLIKTIVSLPKTISKVGVFVNDTQENILQQATIFNLDYIQLHGTERPAFCEELKKQSFKIIKAFSITPNFNFQETQEYQEVVDLFLFDTATPDKGGSGQTFNWQILEKYTYSKPYLLAGGLSLHNINQATAIKHHQLLGLDLNSKFETKPGLKNIEELKLALIKNKKINKTKPQRGDN